ncbi:MAG: DEAD/DEAH box helicase [Candidatus Paceibacterota bacterium]|jgi:ATP-dependent RNA helicase RhlE
MNEEKGFYGLGIAPGILQVLAKLNFKIPTPIQEQSIPIAIEGKDVMGIAQTGTGKTLAFGIPLIQSVLRDNSFGLVIVPTRELAIQVAEALEKVGLPLGLRTATLIGGESIAYQIRRLHRSPQIIIGTPGRIIDHLGQKTLALGKVKILVLDEADRMLDMGFTPQLKKILPHLPHERQTMFFSATMPPEIVAMARAYLKLPVRVEVARSGSTVSKVTQELFFVSQDSKLRLLEKILQEYRGSVLVFSRTKFTAKRIAASVRALGISATEIHANRSLNQRKEALEGFKRGRYRVLAATDIAARGIDVDNIELVLNYDLPENAEDYVHRIGRTGRAGESGHAISFARPNQSGDVRAIERLIQLNLPVSKIPNLPPPSPSKPQFFESGRTQTGQRRNFSSPKNKFGARPSFGNKPSFGSKPRFNDKPKSNFDGRSRFNRKVESGSRTPSRRFYR